ncbi:uncharacterized protein LOC133930237 [Phragmites australis]|uniref:uncharacterized protein LOC133930237 n=1 Tax=Phragmites australis TaxID=29695 RepID=UPI002D7864EF|nr:uncharacterized protein LOC133930237 [Phragmites australis]
MGDESSEDGENASGLLRLVWFRQMLHRWQSSSTVAARRLGADDADGPDASTDRQDNDTATSASADDDNDGKPLLPTDRADRRLPRVVVVEEHRRALDAEGDNPGSSPMTPMTPEAPADVPRGCCAVYVGAERRRFVVPTAYMGMPVFRRLLEKAEEEFGFDYHGAGLTIPCDTEAFKYILVVMDRHRQGLVDDGTRPNSSLPAAIAPTHL